MNKQCVLKRGVIALIFIADVNSGTIMVDPIIRC